MTTPITATPAKLNDGSWGAWIKAADFNIGDKIRIRTKSGKTWTTNVTAIEKVMDDRDLALVRTGDARTTGGQRKTADYQSGWSGKPTAKQITFADRLIEQIRAIPAFSTVAGSGQQHANRLGEMMDNAKTAKDVSRVIDEAKGLIDEQA